MNLKKIQYCIFIYFISFLTNVNTTYAFSKLKNGFETITTSYLIPLAGAVAGTAFISYVTLSFVKQDEYQKKAGNVAILSVFAGSGVHLINSIIQSFS